MEQIRIYEPRPLERVVILGMGVSIMNWFNDVYNDPLLEEKVEVWTVNWGALVYKHHLAFNCHNFQDPEYKALAKVAYKNQEKPLVTLFAQEDMPCTHSYPIKDVIEEFNTTYLMNGVGYMAAYAALCHKRFGGLKLVRFYGCDYEYAVPGMEGRRENGRSNVEYWAGILHSMGVNVGSAEMSMLFDSAPRLQSGMYGWKHHQPQIEVSVDGEKETAKFTGFAEPMDMSAAEASIQGAMSNGHAVQP